MVPIITDKNKALITRFLCFYIQHSNFAMLCVLLSERLSLSVTTHLPYPGLFPCPPALAGTSSRGKWRQGLALGPAVSAGHHSPSLGLRPP